MSDRPIDPRVPDCATQEAYAFTVFERVFNELGLPKAIRTDNGVPFASGWALFGIVLAQMGLGVATLLLSVPLALALFHQAGAMLLLTAAVIHLHLVVRRI